MVKYNISILSAVNTIRLELLHIMYYNGLVRDFDSSMYLILIMK